jgi:hypothetical protein
MPAALLFKKFPTFYGTKVSLSLLKAKLIQSTSIHIYIEFVLLLSSQLLLFSFYLLKIIRTTEEEKEIAFVPAIGPGV